MVFSSLIFLFYFLPFVLCVYYLAPRKVRNLVLLVCSLVFYAWGEPVYIVLMIFSSLVDYTHGILIEKNRSKPRKARLFLLSSIVINLGLLGSLKYYDFIAGSLNHLLNLSLPLHHLPLPIGISFYTFQTMSYSIDVYRGDTKAQRSLLSFATYVTLFPQLIAGPIVRYQTIAEQIDHRRESVGQFSSGMKLFITGLGKKVLLANNIGLLWSQIRSTAPGELTVVSAWLGIIAFGLQVYFDFSGYSDMAIGMGRMFGFEFLKNFDYPYMSQSITEFWRRWHISLGSWFRDYVYIPLGGNRVKGHRLYLNLFIVWALTGLWHGASWNFVAWGLYFWALLSIERACLKARLERLPQYLRHLYVLVLLAVGWVLFEFDDFTAGWQYLNAMFGLGQSRLLDYRTISQLLTNALVLGASIIGATPLMHRLGTKLKGLLPAEIGPVLKLILTPALYLIIMLFSTAYLVDASYNPFLYFRF